MSAFALLTCLGFPGWSPLHLLLADREPEDLLSRLAPLVEAQHRLPAPQLLPLLLHCLDDPSPWPPVPLPALRGSPAGRGRRYRLVCRPGATALLRLQVWLPPEPGGSHWRNGGCQPLLSAARDQTGLGLRLPSGSGDARSSPGR